MTILGFLETYRGDCGRLMKITRAQGAVGNQLGKIMQSHGHDVLHLALAFDITIGLKHGSIPRGISATVVNVGPDNQIHDAGFILQRFKHDSFGGAGALANNDDAGHAHPPSMRAIPHLGGGNYLAAGQFRSDELNRMSLER